MKIMTSTNLVHDELLQSGSVFLQTPLGARLAGLAADGSPGQRRLAAFILRNPIRVAALSIEELARATEVSAPTISRFARETGLGGFADLRGSVAQAVQTLLDPVAKLKLQLDKTGDAARGRDMLQAIQMRVQQLDVGLIAAQAEAFARDIATARSVHVMGFGLSAHLAALLVLGLQPFCPNVSGVVEFGGTEVAAGKLMGIGPGDILIAITFPRYASDVVSLARYAGDRGARVIAITDSPASPLAALADVTLLAPSDHPTLSSSMVAAVAIVETLITAVMLSDPTNAEKAAMLGDAIGRYLHKG
jgi:DNA-binding MurR/RpiR family transcriptional regulator